MLRLFGDFISCLLIGILSLWWLIKGLGVLWFDWAYEPRVVAGLTYLLFSLSMAAWLNNGIKK